MPDPLTDKQLAAKPSCDDPQCDCGDYPRRFAPDACPIPLTNEQLAEIRKRADLATMGPWDWEYDGLSSLPISLTHVSRHAGKQDVLAPRVIVVGGAMVLALGKTDDDVLDIEDQDFIAHSRADVPKLLDEVERLQKDTDIMAGVCAALEARAKQLEDADHLRQSRMGEAVEYWRRSTGRDDATPPLGDLLAFLLREIEELRTRLAQ